MKTHLVVPGLLGYLPRLGELDDLPRFPLLERLLSRASVKPAQTDYFQTLFELYGLETFAKGDLPTAAVSYHAEPGIVEFPDSFLFHADPVHLRPDQDRLLAFDFSQSPISEADAVQFAEAFNQHFAQDGLQLFTPHASRWYISVEKAPELCTHPLFEIVGRNIDFFLPQGGDSVYWNSWMNELQMLFYDLPVNAAREAEGRLPVSSLWLSGGGVLPAPEATGFVERQGECVILDGLDRLCAGKKDENLFVEHAPGRAVLDADPKAWLAAVQKLEDGMAGLLENDLILHPCEGRSWHWRAGMHRHFWRRPQPFTRWIASE